MSNYRGLLSVGLIGYLVTWYQSVYELIACEQEQDSVLGSDRGKVQSVEQ